MRDVLNGRPSPVAAAFRLIWTTAWVASVYFVLARLGLSLAQTHDSVSLIWPPSGFALALALLRGKSAWPGIALGAFVANAITSDSVPAALGIALGNTLEAVIGAALVRRYAGGLDAFSRGRHVLLFALHAGVLSTAVAASIGPTSLALAGLAPWREAVELGLTWWCGDLGGVLVVAPFIVLWANRGRLERTSTRQTEAAFLLLAVALIAVTVFIQPFSRVPTHYPLAFLCMPVLIWAATRFGPRETALGILLTSVVAVRGTLAGRGPFALGSTHQALFLLTMFMCVTALTVLVLATVIQYHHRIENAIRRVFDELGIRYRRRGSDLTRAVATLRSAVRSMLRAERYADAIVQTLREPLLVLDSDLRVRTANTAFYQFAGLTPEETINRRIYDLSGGQWRIPELQALLEETLPLCDAVAGIEMAHAFPGLGRRIIVLNAQRLVRDKSRSPFILLAFQDVTERRRAEEALRTSNERFRAVTESAADAIVSADEIGRIIFMNPAGEAMFGLTAEEANLLPLDTFVLAQGPEDAELPPGADAPNWRRLLGQLGEATGRRRNATTFPLEISVTSWRARDAINYTLVGREISERKLVEQKLRKSEMHLERAQALAHVGSWEWSTQDKTLRCSRELFRIFGLDPMPGAVGESVFIEHVHPQDLRLVEERLRRSMETTEPIDVDFRIVRPDGTIRWVRGFGEVVLGPGGSEGMSGIAEDITDRKRADHKIRQLNAQLERRVQERTAQLERSNLELQQFAYVAAHDLQEPVRTVAAYTQLLARRYRGKLDAEADEIIDLTTQGSMWMHRLIEDLLLYSRVGSVQMQTEEIGLDVVVARAISNLHGAITDSGAVIEMDPLPIIHADSSQLSLLFQNLIANAIKFRGKDSPRIRIHAERDGEEWKVAIRDNGMGIDSKFHERIFAIFQRLHTREEYPGTGIGLAVCKKVVLRHGGRIWAESELGRGTTFFFTLPVSVKAESPATRHGE